MCGWLKWGTWVEHAVDVVGDDAMEEGVDVGQVVTGSGDDEVCFGRVGSVEGAMVDDGEIVQEEGG